jgi:hypothetical protein
MAALLVQINDPIIGFPTKHTAFHAALEPVAQMTALLPKVLSEHKLLLISGYAIRRIDPQKCNPKACIRCFRCSKCIFAYVPANPCMVPTVTQTIRC